MALAQAQAHIGVLLLFFLCERQRGLTLNTPSNDFIDLLSSDVGAGLLCLQQE